MPVTLDGEMKYSRIDIEVPYRRKFSPGENFRQFCHLLSLAKFFIREYLSCVNDYIEDMAIFTALVKIYSLEY